MNMKKKMTVHRLLSGALVLLGFASCSNEDENLEIRWRYDVNMVLLIANS